MFLPTPSALTLLSTGLNNVGFLIGLHVPLLVLLLRCQLSPQREEARDILHPVVSVEKCSHRIEKILVSVQVLLLLNQMQFKLGAN